MKNQSKDKTPKALPVKPAWNAAAPMKVPGKLSDLYYRHFPR
jgi:hypothetical protein